jgi:hypothetical protein
MVNYGKMAKEMLAEEKRIFTSPSMKKISELRCGYTDWQHYNNISKEMLNQSNFKEYKKSDVAKVHEYTTKLIEDYEKECNEKCAMMLAESDHAHNIPHEWITAKVWAVLLKNPVYKDYVKKYSSFVSKKLHTNILTKPKKNSIIGISNETKTTNSKGDKIMKKNTNETITELDNTMLTSNVAQLTDAVNKILVRLDALEAKNVTPKHEFKKLRETAEEVKKETKKVAKVKKVKKANNEQKAEIVKLQKRAQEGKKSLTKKQLAQYTRMWHAKWQEINKTIDINDKAARSLAFAKGRISCLKKARTY